MPLSNLKKMLNCAKVISEIMIVPEVMILEDDIKQIELLVRHLKSTLKIKPVVFIDAYAAITALEDPQYNFEAYVLDIELNNQELTGIDVAEKIRQNINHIRKPIIFLSSYTHFSFGSLRYLQYFEFVSKGSEMVYVENVLKRALFGDFTSCQTATHIMLSTTKFICEIDVKNVSCIEIIRNEVIITDLLGGEKVYKVRPGTFASICEQLSSLHIDYLQQVHRCIILNLHRIRKIEWRKNTATVWLFNVSSPKPVGKTFLEKIKVFRE